MPTKIDWCHAVWNPVWGCTNKCWYCYAVRMSVRMNTMMIRKEDNYRHEHDLPVLNIGRMASFNPTFLYSQINRKFSKKEKLIFVNSMSDISDWKIEWIEEVLVRIRKDPMLQQKIFLFLTKNPEIYLTKHFTYAPTNCWFGTTVTNTHTMIKKNFDYTKQIRNKFISIEPLMDDQFFSPAYKSTTETFLKCFDWVIVGPMTGPGCKKHPIDNDMWIELCNFCMDNKIPFFTKSAITRQKWWKKSNRLDLVQQFPIGVQDYD